MDALVAVVEAGGWPVASPALRRAYLQRCPHSRLALWVGPGEGMGPSPAPLSRLTRVQLSHAVVSSAALARLLTSFALLPSLTALDASYTAVNDACLPALTLLLRQVGGADGAEAEGDAAEGGGERDGGGILRRRWRGVGR